MDSYYEVFKIYVSRSRYIVENKLETEKLDNKYFNNIDDKYGFLYAMFYDVLITWYSVLLLAFSDDVHSAYSLLRNIIERTIYAQYFILDYDNHLDWLKEKYRISITGNNGVIDKLSDESFMKSKMGKPYYPFMEGALGEVIKRLYNEYSKIIHGKVMKSIDFIEAQVIAGDDIDKKLEFINKKNKKNLLQFLKVLPYIFDITLFIFSYSLIIITNFKYITEKFNDDDELIKHLKNFKETYGLLEEFINKKKII